MPKAKPTTGEVEVDQELAPESTIVGSSEQLAIWETLLTPDGPNVIVEAVAGSGKCLGRGTPVLLHRGAIVAVERIRQGDTLMGSDSNPRRVLSVNKGTGPLYRVIPTKGDPFVCNDAHVLTLSGTNRFKGRTIDISVMDYLKACAEQKSFSNQWKLFRVGVTWKEEAVPFDPYLVGLWLGDGDDQEPTITTADQPIIEYLKIAAEIHNMDWKLSKDRNHWRVRLNTREAKFHPFRRFIQSRCHKYEEKSIPWRYLITSRSQRLKLLAGLIDSDGHYSCGYYEITTKYETLATEILFLARSLGFAAYSSMKMIEISKDQTNAYHRITISGKGLEHIPVILERKKANRRQQIKRATVTGFELEPIGEGEYFGFTLDGDGRFLLGDFTVTHNTRTITEYCMRETRSISMALVAFNKHIADELANRMAGKTTAQCMTYHSMGFRALKKRFGRLELMSSRTDDVLDGLMGKSKGSDSKKGYIRARVRKLVSLAKQYGQYTQTDLEWLVDQHAVEIPNIESDVYDLVPKVMRKCREVKSGGGVDYDDMIWLPKELGLEMPYYDVVMVDEFQDTSQVQQWMALHSTNRLVVVGDPHQAIYGWRGADTGGFQRVREVLQTTARGVVTLPLTFTRRCPKSHVKLAQRIVPEIQALDNAPDGIVRIESTSKAIEQMAVGDLVICRVNAPLLGTAYKLLKRGVRAVVRGRDIGEGLKKLIELGRKRVSAEDTDDVQEVLSACDQISSEQITKLQRKPNNEQRVLALRDRMECLWALAEGVTGKSIQPLMQMIGQLFDDFDDDGKPVKAVVLGTVHRTKGLEAYRVWVLAPDKIPHPMARKEWEHVGELNLGYVAVTRAKCDDEHPGELIFVGGESKLFKLGREKHVDGLTEAINDGQMTKADLARLTPDDLTPDDLERIEKHHGAGALEDLDEGEL